MKLLIISVLALAGVLTVLMIIWIGPAAVHTGNSACEQYPYTSGCR